MGERDNRIGITSYVIWIRLMQSVEYCDQATVHLMRSGLIVEYLCKKEGRQRGNAVSPRP
jgi:hypothetical protein